VEIRRITLFGKLNQLGYKSIERATTYCKMRGNAYVELVHWLNQIMIQQDSDVLRICRHFRVDLARLAGDLTAALDRLPRGATAISGFSPYIDETIERAWIYASLLFGVSRIRTGHLVVALTKVPSLKKVFTGISKEFAKIEQEELSDNFDKIVGGSPEDGMTTKDGTPAASSEGGAQVPAA
jgi:type VI secretion system protein VasG